MNQEYKNGLFLYNEIFKNNLINKYTNKLFFYNKLFSNNLINKYIKDKNIEWDYINNENNENKLINIFNIYDINHIILFQNYFDYIIYLDLSIYKKSKNFIFFEHITMLLKKNGILIIFKDIIYNILYDIKYIIEKEKYIKKYKNKYLIDFILNFSYYYKNNIKFYEQKNNYLYIYNQNNIYINDILNFFIEYLKFKFSLDFITNDNSYFIFKKNFYLF